MPSRLWLVLAFLAAFGATRAHAAAAPALPPAGAAAGGAVAVSEGA